LRKRKVDFSRTEEILKNIEEQKRRKIAQPDEIHDQKKGNQASKNETSQFENRNCIAEDSKVEESELPRKRTSSKNNERADSNNTFADCDFEISKSDSNDGNTGTVTVEDATAILDNAENKHALNSIINDFVSLQSEKKSTFETNSESGLVTSSQGTSESTSLGSITDEDIVPLRVNEKKKLDFSNKLYLAPLTTVGCYYFLFLLNVYFCFFINLLQPSSFHYLIHEVIVAN